METARNRITGKRVDSEDLWDIESVDQNGYICTGCNYEVRKNIKKKRIEVDCIAPTYWVVYLTEKGRAHWSKGTKLKGINGRKYCEKNNPEFKVEPPKNYRGDIARIYFYMQDKYGLEFSDKTFYLMKY